MIDNKEYFRRFATPVLILVAVVAWIIMRSRTDNPDTPIRLQKAPEQHLATHNDLVADRLGLLEEMKKGDRNYDFKVPIDFFGKVLDQSDNPVAGTNIEIRLNVADDNGQKKRTLVSREDGTFSLTGIGGTCVFVDIYSKNGYTCGEMGHRGSYNYAIPEDFKFHVPDPNQPVIFRLWKYEHPEPIHLWQLTSEVRTDGTVIWFDIDKGLVGGAGLGVSLIDEMPGNTNEEKHTIKVIAGPGCVLATTKDDPMFTAPEKMDKTDITVVHAAKNGYYNTGPGIFRFYYRTAQGKYAAVKAEVSAGSHGVQLVIYQNPSGSRNLEYDPALQINK